MELLISVHSHEHGARSNSRFALAGALTLGRGPESPVLLDGTGISREHLRLHSEGDGLFITDLSSNGTWLNSQRLLRGKPHPFTPVDVIKVPGFDIRVSQESDPAAGVSRERKVAVITPPEISGPLESTRAFWASMSKGEELLIVLALTTLGLVLLYLLT